MLPTRVLLTNTDDLPACCRILQSVTGGLVLLFWRQMFPVSDQLPGEFMDHVSQGTFGKAEIVAIRPGLVDNGQSSIIF